MGAKRDDSEQLFNRNLTALVAVIFLFYGGLSCLYSTFIPHLIELGFRSIEISHILTIVALVSILGPLIFAPVVDLIADRYKGQFGRYLQYILALLLILGAIAYSRLLVVPAFRRTPSEEPSITFGCNQNSAVIFQQRCGGDAHCHYWDDEKLGELELVNCSYTCQNPEKFEIMYHGFSIKPPISESAAQPLTESAGSKEDFDYDDRDQTIETQSQRQRRDTSGNDPRKVEPPHICTQNKNNHSIIDRCQVYTKDNNPLKINAKLHSAIKQENDTKYCRYPIGNCFILPIKIRPKLA